MKRFVARFDAFLILGYEGEDAVCVDVDNLTELHDDFMEVGKEVEGVDDVLVGGC